jgi:hypothetical protein
VRRPLSFAWRNLLFGRDVDDCWALYRLHTRSYAGLATSGKREVLASLIGFAADVEADFQVLRVTRAWSADSYLAMARAGVDGRHGDRAGFERLLALHDRGLRDRAPVRPEVFLSVRLGPPNSAALRQLAAALRTAGSQSPLNAVRRLLGFGDPRGLSQRRLDELLDEETRVFAGVTDFLDAERASTRELQWLVRRAFHRGLPEPWLDEFWRPQALVLDAEDEEGGRRFVPLETDVLRLFEEPIDVDDRCLCIATEHGDSHQALLVLGALPEVTTFPGRQAELLFAPLEDLPFPVDACFGARWVPNDQALALARRKIIDADHAYTEESHGDHGPSADSAVRPELARELEEYLTASDRPPLLRAQVGLAVGAASVDELERRVERLRREYAPVRLHRPLGEQMRLFVSHLPAQLSAVPGYDDVLLLEQFGAMVPVATHAVGSDVGLYVGHTLSAAGHPVLFDLTEGSRTSRPPAVLCAGTLGSGKTITAQLLGLQGYLAGSRVVDIDPKGDHRLADAIGHEHVERVELRPGAEHRGTLDPLRIAPPDTRAELAYSFLIELLPAPVPAPWQTEIRAAVEQVAAGDGGTCGDVLTLLESGSEDASGAARAIGVHASAGLLRLGFAERGAPPPPAGQRPVTCLTIANLTLPLPGTPRTELTTEERTGRALLRLLATYALHLMGSDWSRHKVLLFDEAWMLLEDAAGLALVQRINRLCRSQNATPILVTQLLTDVSSLAELAGAVFAFGVETDAEARRALELLGLEGDDARMRAQLRAFRRGRCFLRDYEGRVAAMQVDVADDELLAVLDTTPRRATGVESRDGNAAPT